MKVFNIIMCIVTTSGSIQHEDNSANNFKSNSNSTDNVSHNNSLNIQDIKEEVFKILYPNKKIEILKIVHNVVKNITKKNIHDEKKRINNVYIGDKNVTRFYDATGLTDSEYYLKANDPETEDTSTNYYNTSNATNFYDKEIKSFLKQLTKTNLKNQITNNNNKTVLFRRNLKIWRTLAPDKEQHFPSEMTRRIYAGRVAHVHEYPFIASIHVNGEFTCAGSIIGQNFVITAASCFLTIQNPRKHTKQYISVRIGSDYTNKYGKLVPISQVYTHPSFNSTNLWNNLAIVKMEPHLDAKYKIRRIPFDTNKANIPTTESDEILVLGWGATNESRSLQPVQSLKYASLNVYHIEDCKSFYSSYYVTRKHFCVGFINKGGGACNRDVGGPGILDGILVGIISFGPAICGNPDEPTVLIRINMYTDWIKDTIEKIEQNEVLRAPREPQVYTSVKRTKIHKKIQENPKHKALSSDNSYAEWVVKEAFNDVILKNHTLIDNSQYNDIYQEFDLLLQSKQKGSVSGKKIPESEPYQKLEDNDRYVENYKEKEYNGEPEEGAYGNTKSSPSAIPNEFYTSYADSSIDSIGNEYVESLSSEDMISQNKDMAETDNYTQEKSDYEGLAIGDIAVRHGHTTFKTTEMTTWALPKLMVALDIIRNHQNKYNLLSKNKALKQSINKVKPKEFSTRKPITTKSTKSHKSYFLHKSTFYIANGKAMDISNDKYDY